MKAIALLMGFMGTCMAGRQVDLWFSESKCTGLGLGDYHCNILADECAHYFHNGAACNEQVEFPGGHFVDIYSECPAGKGIRIAYYASKSGSAGDWTCTGKEKVVEYHEGGCHNIDVGFEPNCFWYSCI